jgi:hypothetical protein
MFTLAILALCPAIQADHKPATMMLGGSEFYIGMSKAEAGRLLASCCKVRPPLDENIEAATSAVKGGYAGHFVLSKDSSTMLGGIFFSNGRVVRITRGLNDDFDEQGDDVVAFVRVLKRTLASYGEEPMSAVVAVQRQSMGDGESDIIFIKLSDGRGIQIELATTDKPSPGTNKRDWVSVDETLEPTEPTK